MRRIANILLLWCLVGVTWAQPLRFAVEPYCPYVCTDEERTRIDPKLPGAQIEIVRAIFEAQGYALEFDPMPFARAVVSVRAGEVQGMVGVLKQDAPDLIFPTVEGGVLRGCFLVRNGDPWRFLGIDSLRNRRFGGVADYSYGVLNQYLADNLKSGSVQLLSGEDALERNLNMLLRERIDVTLDDKNRIQYLFSRRDLGNQFQFAGCIEQPLWIFIPFSPASPDAKRLASLFDQGIELLRRSGRLEAILARYGLVDWR